MPVATLKKILPLIGFLLLSGITLWLWKTLSEHRGQLLLHHMETSAEQLRTRIAGMMNARIAALEMIADRWVDRRPPDFSHERFLGLAGTTVEHYPGLAGIYWIDPAGMIQWVYPAEVHKAAVGSSARDHPDERFRTSFSAAGATEACLLTPCVPLHSGETGFYAVKALRVDGRLQGYLTGVFRSRQVMEMSLSPAMLEAYRVTAHEEDQPIYRNDAHPETDPPSPGMWITRDISFAGKTWQLRLEPKAREYHPRPAADTALLTFGFGLSAMLALTLYFLLQRMEMDRDTRDQALREVSERRQAEEQIQLLTHQLLRAQENERQKLSRDLHDTIGQDLSTLKIGIDTLLDNLPGIGAQTQEKVSKLSKMLQSTIATVRDLSYDLRPATLDQLGLVQTIRQYAEDFSERNGVEVDFLSAGMDDLELGYEMRITLYRLVQEGLNNVRKHAEARKVTLRLVASFPMIILQMEDDGKGFDVRSRSTAALKERRMGLRSMEERVALLGGGMRLDSRPAQGTRIRIEVPFRETKDGDKENRSHRR